MENVNVNIEFLVSQFDYGEFNEHNFEAAFSDMQSEDTNNFAIVEVESGDEDIELDVEDDMASINMALTRSPQQDDYLNKVFCVTQSYVIVRASRVRTLCYFCYYLHQFFLESASTHNHVNTHIRRKLRNSNQDLHCAMCFRALYQIILPEACLQCNHGSRHIEADWDTNIPIIP